MSPRMFGIQFTIEQREYVTSSAQKVRTVTHFILGDTFLNHCFNVLFVPRHLVLCVYTLYLRFSNNCLHRRKIIDVGQIFTGRKPQVFIPRGIIVRIMEEEMRTMVKLIPRRNPFLNLFSICVTGIMTKRLKDKSEHQDLHIERRY